VSRKSLLNTNFYALVALTFFCCASFGATVKTSNSALALELPSSWKNAANDDDPDIVLDCKSGGAELTFKSLGQELGDRFLQTRLKDDITALRGRGYTLQGNIEDEKMHAGATFYYTSYELGSKNIKIGYFTYAGNSYSVTATNMGDQDFSDMLYTLRKQGAPAPVRVVAKPKKSKHKEEEAEAAPLAIDENGNTTVVSTASPAELAASTAPVPQVSVVSATAAAAAAPAVAQVPAQAPAPVVIPKPMIPRSPLPLYVWAALLLIWYFAGHGAAESARHISYPKIAPLPKDVPPDFFFPFIITRFVLPRELQYALSSRQQQKLTARCERHNENLLMNSIYWLLAFHVGWSIVVLTPFAQTVADNVLLLPGGPIIASFPEAPFILMMIVGAANYRRGNVRISLFDKEEKMALEALAAAGTVMLKDGKGKEVGRISRLKGRDWALLDVDKEPVLELREDHPELYNKRRLFGVKGGALRARYGIFVKDRRAGFVLNDPSSENKFQIHFEFGYARLAPPTHIVMVVLYALSVNRDYPTPWIS
jgi:hypothetical protein